MGGYVMSAYDCAIVLLGAGAILYLTRPRGER